MDRRSFEKLLVGGGVGAGLLLNSNSLQAKSFEGMNPADYLKLPSNFRSIFDQAYPQFTEQEYSRRKQALVDVMNAQDIDTVLVVTTGGLGNATRWLTNWPGTQQALTVFKPNQNSTMFVEYHNHVAQAKILARDTEVIWGGDKGMAPLMEFLAK